MRQCRMHILSRGPKWAKVRAKHDWIMARLLDGRLDPNRKLGTPNSQLFINGTENCMWTMAKAYYKGGGVWLIAGYRDDNQDVDKVLGY